MRQTILPCDAARSTSLPQAGSGRRRLPVDDLRQLSDQLDRLLQDVSIGASSQRQHDDHVHRAEDIATGLRAVFRGPEGKPIHPPLMISGGRAMW